MGLVSRIVRQLTVSGFEYGLNIAASYTFSDKAAWNNEVNELFPTIAFELAHSIPGLLEQYRSTMTKEDSRKLMNTSLKNQFRSFIVNPILKLPISMDQARTVIVNGIDRCGYRKARTVLTIITDALEVFDLPLRFIISSNRDTRIQDVFNLPSLSKVSRNSL
ncbi:hypothetical protein CPB84DRAFT_1057305 [Gymnopilus junonius]|uniref:Nephrocystin 3-like N-terminal domain-containing protein n=1 Tax=Gymnopilus junonius TaxID=109634 RepID=A0A9P5NQ71_GYMJU|nr:hypothetical protein CPB84DRAFT_1057305 [Gymnopilus junonius]